MDPHDVAVRVVQVIDTQLVLHVERIGLKARESTLEPSRHVRCVARTDGTERFGSVRPVQVGEELLGRLLLERLEDVRVALRDLAALDVDAVTAVGRHPAPLALLLARFLGRSGRLEACEGGFRARHDLGLGLTREPLLLGFFVDRLGAISSLPGRAIVIEHVLDLAHQREGRVRVALGHRLDGLRVGVDQTASDVTLRSEALHRVVGAGIGGEELVTSVVAARLVGSVSPAVRASDHELVHAGVSVCLVPVGVALVTGRALDNPGRIHRLQPEHLLEVVGFVDRLGLLLGPVRLVRGPCSTLLHPPRERVRVVDLGVPLHRLDRALEARRRYLVDGLLSGQSQGVQAHPAGHFFA